MIVRSLSCVGGNAPFCVCDCAGSQELIELEVDEYQYLAPALHDNDLGILL